MDDLSLMGSLDKDPTDICEVLLVVADSLETKLVDTLVLILPRTWG